MGSYLQQPLTHDAESANRLQVSSQVSLSDYLGQLSGAANISVNYTTESQTTGKKQLSTFFKTLKLENTISGREQKQILSIAAKPFTLMGATIKPAMEAAEFSFTTTFTSGRESNRIQGLFNGQSRV